MSLVVYHSYKVDKPIFEYSQSKYIEYPKAREFHTSSRHFVIWNVGEREREILATEEFKVMGKVSLNNMDLGSLRRALTILKLFF
jgi:hypothetical protein